MSRDDQWALTWADLQQIFEECERKDFSCRGFSHFIETGTFLGQTVIALSQHFRELHTIELSPQCFEAAKLFAWKASRSIHFHLGQSTEILKKLLPKISGPSVLYLDAHWSGSVTAGLEQEVPLMDELHLICELLPHACLIIIDDLDLFAKVNSFEAINQQTGTSSGYHSADWRPITCESIKMHCTRRAVGCFQLGDRFVIMLRCEGGLSAASHADVKPSLDTAAAVCPDLVLRSRLGAQGKNLWISTPGLRLQASSLDRVRSQGKWWQRIADAMEREYSNTLGSASTKFKDLQDQMERERAKTAKLCKESVDNNLTHQQCVALHDDLIEAFMAEAFQDKLTAAWTAAGGNKAKEQKAKRETCLPLQLPVMEKFGFEASEKGVFACLWSIRTTFFNFKKIEEMDQELLAKATLLDFLVSPDKQPTSDLSDWASCTYPKTYPDLCRMRSSMKLSKNDLGDLILQ
ncbi:unnamed protein product [Effrenium voratum]|nr:unnamed protein product [Effrenium voratum]